MQVVFVAQTPFAAPGSTLREQLVYPSTRSASGQHLWQLLQCVQLGYLLERVYGDWEHPHDWDGTPLPKVSVCDCFVSLQ